VDDEEDGHEREQLPHRETIVRDRDRGKDWRRR
jgi:hypothetical protein